MLRSLRGPTRASIPVSERRPRDRQNNLPVGIRRSGAGRPAVAAGLRAGGLLVPFPLEAIGARLGFYEGRPFASPYAYAVCDFLLYVNVLWPLLNLVPVPPLDGGQIVREGLLALDVPDAHRIAGMIGVVAGGAVAWWGYTRNEPYLGIMFAMLAASCFQSLSAGPPPWRRWN